MPPINLRISLNSSKGGSMNDISKCPVMHGAITSNSGAGTSNREWWPNQLNLKKDWEEGKNSMTC